MINAAKAGVRAVAIFEAAKGVLVLATATAALRLLHHNAQHAAEELVRRFHLDPAHHYPRIFIDAAANLSDTRLWVLAFCASAYAAARLAEAYGLWHGRSWARSFGLVTACLYVPFELTELARRMSWAAVTVLVVNLITIAILWRARIGRAAPLEPAGTSAPPPPS